MVILLTGASGFIGERLSRALSAAGHVVIEARRDAADGSRSANVDFTRDLDARDWLPKLAGVEIVINAVGILRERGRQTFERIHTLAPQALFAACAAAGGRRVVQISALGARSGTTGYFSSKRAADEFLMTLPIEWTIVEPALVYGPGGASARLFTMLASLPVVALPGGGEQRIQPIHIDDLIEALVELARRTDLGHRRVPLVGPHALSLREFLRQLRASMGLRAPHFLPIPMVLMKTAARLAQLSRNSLLDRDTLTMLAAENTADPALTQQLLRRPARAAATFVEPRWRDAMLSQARLQWLLPLLRLSIAAVWIWTGIVSFGLFPRESSYELLARTGVTGTLATVLLFGAAALDLALGIATVVLRRRRLLWLAQMTLIAGYTLIVTVKLPEFWLHPYGPILKNLPMLAALYMLYSLETPR